MCLHRYVFADFFFFFFQAEDGIRDLYVTGVQTCALPIFDARVDSSAAKDSYKVTAGFDQQANLAFEGVLPPGATVLKFFLSSVGQADGGAGAVCTLKSLTAVVEVFR